jgi:hypothetical protein
MKNQDEETMQTKLEQVNIPIGEIELPQLDVKPYVGRKVKIVDVGTFKGGKFGNYLIRIQTEIVATVQGGKNPIELRGSKIFGLHEDDDGNWGWGTNTKLGKYLQKMKVKRPDELKGKEVILQIQTAQSGTDFLSFA